MASRAYGVEAFGGREGAEARILSCRCSAMICTGYFPANFGGLGPETFSPTQPLSMPPVALKSPQGPELEFRM